MPTKQYWETILKQLESQKESAEGAVEQDNILIEFAKKKISEFKPKK